MGFSIVQAGNDILGIAGLTPGGVGIWIGVIGLFGKWLVQRVAMRKVDTEADGSLRSDLLARINTLEENSIAERRACDERLRAMQDKLDKMQGVVNGLIRQLLQYQKTTGQALPLALRSPEIEHALATLEGLER